MEKEPLHTSDVPPGLLCAARATQLAQHLKSIWTWPVYHADSAMLTTPASGVYHAKSTLLTTEARIRVCSALSGDEFMPWTRFSGSLEDVEDRVRFSLGERSSQTVTLLREGKPFSMREAHLEHQNEGEEMQLELQATLAKVLCHEDVERTTQAVLANPPPADTSPFDWAWVKGTLTATECEAARDDERVASKLLGENAHYFKYLSHQCRDTETLAWPAVQGCEENLGWASARLRRLLAPVAPSQGVPAKRIRGAQ